MQEASMELKKLTDTFSVSAQIRVPDLAALREMGFRAIVCNRPDGEGADQPTFTEIERAARELGIEAHYLPVESGKVSDQDAERFRGYLDTLPRPCSPTAAAACARRPSGRWPARRPCRSSRSLPQASAPGST